MAKNRRGNAWNVLQQQQQGHDDADADLSNDDAREEQIYHKDRKIESNTTIEEILQLHNSDHPGMQLVTVLLTGDNFLNWSRSIRRALGARSKLDLLDGGISEPDVTSKYYKAWIKVDYMVSCWIINSISKEVASAFNHIDSTRKLWTALNHRFNRSNGPKIARLQREIGRCMQGNQTVLSYFDALTVLWNELDMILPPIRCVCEARHVAEEREENQRLMQFLNGLNETYEQARNQVLFLDPLPNVDRAYSMILQVEDQKMTSEAFGDGGVQIAMNVGAPPQGKWNGTDPSTGAGKQYSFKGRKTKEERMSLYCQHCQKHGHEEKECFKLHGYPEWWYKKVKDSKGKFRANYAEASQQDDKSDTGRNSCDIE